MFKPRSLFSCIVPHISHFQGTFQKSPMWHHLCIQSPPCAHFLDTVLCLHCALYWAVRAAAFRIPAAHVFPINFLQFYAIVYFAKVCCSYFSVPPLCGIVFSNNNNKNRVTTATTRKTTAGTTIMLQFRPVTPTVHAALLLLLLWQLLNRNAPNKWTRMSFYMRSVFIVPFPTLPILSTVPARNLAKFRSGLLLLRLLLRLAASWHTHSPMAAVWPCCHRSQ